MPRSATRDAAAPPGGEVLRRLVIVESPSKARSIAKYLGPGWVVESSVGHIRDLPRNASEVPAAHKGKPWARLGVDVENGFEAHYVVSPDKRAQVTKLKALLKDADELYLATDKDREGEAIAWHLLETLKPRVPVRRMVFTEVTADAIRAAAASPRELDTRLVEAQETRRILDRLYGYEVSPVLWRKVSSGLSAGRVQSVATRVLVERERERMRFRSAEHWDVGATLSTGPDAEQVGTFGASLVAVDGRRVATGRDFEDTTGELREGARDVVVLDGPRATSLAEGLARMAAQVVRVEEKPYTRRPYAPFMTSTLQQEGGRKLSWSSARTMQVAQRLYERGFITYMRTDSPALSATAVAAARAQASQLYGPGSVPSSPRHHGSASKNAQEAHEAIRPAGDTFRTPGQVAGELGLDERRLYELVWQRTVASQMVDARGESVSVRLAATTSDGEALELAASGRTITEPGFLRAYVEGADDADSRARDDAESRLPRLAQGQVLAVDDAEPREHRTTPPARYTEASLVKWLDEKKIGRPSTYASIIRTVLDRGYATKRGQSLVPTWTAFAVVGLMEQHFARLVDYDFTASVEDDLDAIATGSQEQLQWLTRFYFGAEQAGGHANSGGLASQGGLKKVVADNLGDIDARGVNSVPLGVDDAGRAVVVRSGRYGPYVERTPLDTEAGGAAGDGGDAAPERASVPEELAPDELTVARAVELLEAPRSDRVLGTHPDTGDPVELRAGRFGPYVTTVPAEGSGASPRRASLFRDMDPAEVGLDTAVRLLSLPRVLGTDAEGVEVTAQNGRYGPYVRRGTDSRSLGGEAELFTVTLADALALLAQPKQRGRGAAKPPLKELGTDPETQTPIVLKDGRFGPYVTDGTSNASLRTGDTVESLTHDRAIELLAERRLKAPPKKPAAKKPPAKKPAAKKPAAKKSAAAKPAAKKTATATRKPAARTTPAARTPASSPAGEESATPPVADAR